MKGCDPAKGLSLYWRYQTIMTRAISSEMVQFKAWKLRKTAGEGLFRINLKRTGHGAFLSQMTRYMAIRADRFGAAGA
jgi:hypothetical protein